MFILSLPEYAGAMAKGDRLLLLDSSGGRPYKALLRRHTELQGESTPLLDSLERPRLEQILRSFRTAN